MTSTEFTVGIGEGARISSKVLKPPGGGSSDIFGVGKSYDSSAVTSEKDSKNEDSSTHSRVFGVPARNEGHKSTQSPVKCNVQSNVVENVSSVPPKQIKKTYIRRNPITGEEIEINIEAESEDKTNGNKKDKEEESQNIPIKPVQTSIRIRNPPGGKSSGIF